MKLCFSCNEAFADTDGWTCPVCGDIPKPCDSIPNFAYKSPGSAGAFPDSFQNLFQLEANNFWFRSRNKLIVWAIAQFFPDAKRFLEIGCGTGYVLSGISRSFPDMKLSGGELSQKGLSFARERLPNADLLLMDASHIPFNGEFDLIGAFDVLEHIREDEQVLKQMRKAVSSVGGGIILTVPQHRFLWSHIDTYSGHVRRYRAVDLQRKVERAGFNVVRMTSFVSLLLPLLAVARLGRRKQPINFNPMTELNITEPFNASLEMIMDLERMLIRAGLSYPMGGSLLLLAKAS
jgi:SAM-dependent methyltransferase